MKNTTFISNIKEAKAKQLLILLSEENTLPACLQPIKQAVRFNMQRVDFTGKLQQACTMTTNGQFPFEQICLVGLGKKEMDRSTLMQELGGWIAANVLNTDTAWDASELDSDTIADIAFGIWLRRWNFDKFRTKKVQPPQLFCVTNAQTDFDLKLQRCRALFNGVALARDLTAEPANTLYPDVFAQRCLELQKEGLEVTVLSEEQLIEMGANGILAVGAGSSRPPCMVAIRWNGTDSQQPPVALVGKGVCYDSGGINIKTTHLVEMKWDKAAAAAVLGTLLGLAQAKIPVNVVGVIGLAENMPDGGALKPSDVIKMLSGITVEVVDTDNEGRLILADCLHFAQEKFQPCAVIDLGTLTLETFGVLAGEYAGLFCEDVNLAQALVTAGLSSGERLWSLPMGAAFAKQIESSVADIKNMGILGYGESSATAEFLKCFIKPGTSWAHIDMAGVAWSQEDQPLAAAGVTGFGVRLLTHYCLSQRVLDLQMVDKS